MRENYSKLIYVKSHNPSGINTTTFCHSRNFASSKYIWCTNNSVLLSNRQFSNMSQQHPLHVTTQLHEADVRGGLSMHSPHCIAYKLPKETVTSLLEKISKKYPEEKHEASIYTASGDWIQSLTDSMARELSSSFNAPSEKFTESA